MTTQTLTSLTKRIEKAADIVRAKMDGSRPWGYKLNADGKPVAYLIPTSTWAKDGTTYQVTPTSCTCYDFANSGLGFCKHQTAAAMYVEGKRDPMAWARGIDALEDADFLAASAC